MRQLCSSSRTDRYAQSQAAVAELAAAHAKRQEEWAAEECAREQEECARQEEERMHQQAAQQNVG